MGNCLVTKLNGVVDNPDLYTLNEFRISFFRISNPQEGSHSLIMDIGEGNVVKVIKGEGTFTVDDGAAVTKYVSTSGLHTIVGANSNFEISIENKYKINILSCQVVSNWNTIEKGWGMDLSKLNYAFPSTIIIEDGNKIQSGLLELKNVNGGTKQSITTLILENTPIDLDSLAYEGSDLYTNINTIIANALGTKGNINSLARYIRIFNRFDSYSPLVTGDVDELFAAQVAAGRTSGTLQTCFIGSSVVDEGNLITQAYIASKGGTYNIVATFDPSAPNGYTKSYT